MRSGCHKIAYFVEGQCNVLGLRDRWIEETFANQKGLDAEYQLVQTPNKAHDHRFYRRYLDPVIYNLFTAILAPVCSWLSNIFKLYVKLINLLVDLHKIFNHLL